MLKGEKSKKRKLKRATDEKLQKLKMEEREVQGAMGKAMSYIDEGGKKMHDGLKAGNMMEVEAGNKLIEFGRQKQSEAWGGRLEDISKERTLFKTSLLKGLPVKKQKVEVHVQVNCY